MISVSEFNKLSLPLIAPQFERGGPFRPGTQIPIVLPLHNLRDDEERDVEIEWCGEAVSFSRDCVVVDRIAPGSTVDVRTVATVLPLNGKREIKISALVTSRGKKTLQTAVASAAIAARAEIVIDAKEQDGRTDIRLSNAGDAPAVLNLTLSTDVQLPDDAMFGEATFDLVRGEGGYTIEALHLDPEQQQVLRIDAIGIKAVSAADTDGNRTSARVCVVANPKAHLDEPTLELNHASAGVRQGDVIPIRLALHNDGDLPIEDAALDLEIPSHLRLLDETLTLDDVRIIPNDRTLEDRRALIRIGRIAADATVTLRGTLLVDKDDNRDFESVDLVGTISGDGIETYKLQAEIPFDHRPAFAQTNTFLGPLTKTENGYIVTATVTNAENIPAERVRIRWDLLNLLPTREPSRSDGRSIELQPTTIEGRPALVTHIGALDAFATESVTLFLRPTIEQVEQHDLGVRAILLAGDASVLLGEQRETVNGESSLRKSSITILDERPLRVGIPVDAKLRLYNSGDAPAKDIRIRLDMPDYIQATLPDVQNKGGWRSICANLPVHSEVATTITFLLVAAPAEEQTTIQVTLDAEGHAPIALEPILLATPTAPRIEPPDVRVLPIEHGMLAVNARIENVGDGTARNVFAAIPNDERDLPALPRSTTVDGIPLEDRGARSPLMQGLPLGNLPPGAFRDVSWIVAPNDEQAYRARIEVRYEGHEPVRGVSMPKRPRLQSNFAVALPEARQIDGALSTSYVPRRATVTVVENERELPGAQRGLPSPTPPPDLYGRALSATPEAAAASAAAAHEDHKLTGDELPAPPPSRALGSGDAGLQSQQRSNDVAPPQPPSAVTAQTEAVDQLTQTVAAETRDAGAHSTETRQGETAPPVLQESADAQPPVNVADPTPHADANGSVAEPSASAHDESTSTSVSEQTNVQAPNADADTTSNGSSSSQHDAPFDDRIDATGHTTLGDIEPKDVINAATEIIASSAAASEEHEADVPSTLEYFSASANDPHIRRSMRLASTLMEIKGLGWWRHVFVLRSLLAEIVPGDEIAQSAFADLRDSLDSGVISAYPKVLVAEFRISPEWVGLLRANDERVYDALTRYAEASNSIPMPGAYTTGEIEGALTRVIVQKMRDANMDAELESYVGRLRGTFGNPDIIALDDAARYERFSRMPNATLDEQLLAVVDAYRKGSVVAQ